MGRFSERTVLITGAAKGIGAGCARVFHSEGGNVSIIDRDVPAGEQLVAELDQQESGRAMFLECDVSVPEQIESAVAETVEEFGRLDCLINNAGVHPPAMTIDDTPIELMESLMWVNYLSTFAGCKFAAGPLRETNGSIVNVSSMTAVLGQEHSVAYAATKAAQVGLTRALALEMGRAGVRVNAILPSNIDTPLMRQWAETLPDPASALERVSELQVFGRMGTPEEIGRVALFLATEDSSFITGQAIEAEGGASLDY